MAILGFHIVLTLISASILQKFSARYSLGRRLLSFGLYRYLQPSIEDLRHAAGLANVKNKGHKRNNAKKKPEDSDTFPVPKSTVVELARMPVLAFDVLQLPFYVDFRWLIDFTLCTIGVFACSEFYTNLTYGAYSSEINLSVVWCLMTLAFALKCLTSLTAMYFRSDGGEKQMVIGVGIMYFLITFTVLLGVERFFDVSLQSAYENFTATADEFIKEQDLHMNRGSQTSVLLYVFFAILFGVLAGMLVFPSFRYSKMYLDSLQHNAQRPFVKLMIHFNFFCPLFALCLWIKPLSHALLNRDPSVINIAQLEGLRLWSIVWILILRILLLRTSLQSYLNLAQDKLVLMRQESGRIDSTQLQDTVQRIYVYLCVVATQYMVPVILISTMALLLKVLGEFSWLLPFGAPDVRMPMLASLVAQEPVILNSANTDLRHSMLQLAQLFNTHVNRGVWSFLVVMVTAINLSLNMLGMLYNTYFQR